MLRRCAATSKLPLTIRQLLSSPQTAGQETRVQVNGWIKSVRRQKNVIFAVVNDGSCASGLQAVLKPAATPEKCVSQGILGNKCSQYYSLA